MEVTIWGKHQEGFYSKFDDVPSTKAYVIQKELNDLQREYQFFVLPQGELPPGKIRPLTTGENT